MFILFYFFIMVYYPNLIKNKTSEKEPKIPKLKNKLRKIIFLLFLIAIATGGYFVYRTSTVIKKISGSNSSIIDNVNHLIPFGKKDTLEGEQYGRINVLLLGMRGADDPHGGLLTDSIIIASIKLSKPECEIEDLSCLRKRQEMIPEKIALISIPRDLFVEVPGYSGLRKLNEAHFLGEKAKKDGGLALMQETISQVTNLPIHYGISIDFKGFKEVIEQLEGVEVNVPRDFSDPNYDGGISVKAGKQKMDAETALRYAQARMTSNDFDRARRQQLILVGIKERAMSKDILSNPIKALSILDSLGKHLRTDMQLWEIQRFMELSQGMNDESKTIHKIFDTSPEGLLYSTHINGAYALRPKGDNFDQMREVILNIFN